MSQAFAPDLNSFFDEIVEDMRLSNMPINKTQTIDAYLNERISPFQYDPNAASTPAYPSEPPKRDSVQPDLYMDYLTLSVGQDPSIPIPDYFDLHLEPDLRLRHVKSFPHLPIFLKKMLSESLFGHPLAEKEINSVHYLGETTRLEAQLQLEDVSVADENQIPDVHHYWEDSATTLATDLFMHSESWASDREKSCVTWTSAGSKAFVSVHPEFAPPPSEHDGDLLTVNSSITAKLQAISDMGLSNVVLFDFKRIGRPFNANLFKAIQAIADGHVQFAWTACSIPGCSPKCRIPGTSEATVSGRRTGLDSVKMTNLLRRLEEETQTPNLDYTSKSADISPEMINKALYLLQELWASAVDVDTTFMVLSSGNEEIIGIRHRDTQMLYLSETLEVTRSRYTQSAVINQYLPTHLRGRCGLILWSLHDAVDRTIQMTEEDTNLPERFYREYDEDGQRIVL